MRRRKSVTAAQQETFRKRAQAGGAAVVAKYGVEHFREMGRKGAVAARPFSCGRAGPEWTYKPVLVRVHAWQWHALGDYAAESGIARPEIIRRVLESFLRNGL